MEAATVLNVNQASCKPHEAEIKAIHLLHTNLTASKTPMFSYQMLLKVNA